MFRADMPSARTLVLVLATAAALFTACKSPCRQLAEKACDCSVNTSDKEACLTEASARESNTNVTDADNQVCADLLPKCDCHLLDTPQGKRDCGLAR